MKKIPTLFRRNPEDMRRVLREVTPGCEWVLAGEGVATRKYDGTAMLFHDQQWWARREVKPAKEPPPNFYAIETDPNTGKTVGWEPAEQSGFAKWLAEAAQMIPDPVPGTYELCGPKVNGNPEGYGGHILIEHALAEEWPDAPRTFAELREWLTDPEFAAEGLVWHHPDGRMAKLKRRDFPIGDTEEGSR